MSIMKINKGLLVLSLLLLSVGKLSAEDFGYELKDGTLTILMYGGFDDWKKAGIHDKSSVTKIVIDEGVPIVPNQVFKDMRHVKSVTILIVSVNRYHRSARIGTIIAEEPVPL